MTYLTKIVLALAFLVGMGNQHIYAHELESNKSITRYDMRLSHSTCSCNIDLADKYSTPAHIRKSLAQLNMIELNIIALSTVILNEKIKLDHSQEDGSLGLYCTGYGSQSLVIMFDPFSAWDLNVNNEFLVIMMEVLDEHPELKPLVELLSERELPSQYGQYSDRAKFLWDWLYKNIEVTVSYQ